MVREPQKLVHPCIHSCLFVCIYVHTHVCIYIYIYMCVYVCIFTTKISYIYISGNMSGMRMPFESHPNLVDVAVSQVILHDTAASKMLWAPMWELPQIRGPNMVASNYMKSSNYMVFGM